MGRVVIRPGQPSPALLPDRCQQGAAALAWVSLTTTSPREWGNQARVIYASTEHAGHYVSAWSVCILWACTCVFRSPPLLQHPAINLLWHAKLNLWANLLATDTFDLKRERMELKKMKQWEWTSALTFRAEYFVLKKIPFSCVYFFFKVYLFNLFYVVSNCWHCPIMSKCENNYLKVLFAFRKKSFLPVTCYIQKSWFSWLDLLYCNVFTSLLPWTQS